MKSFRENFMKAIFLSAACTSIAAVALICYFMFSSGLPTIARIGPAEFLLGRSWKPLNDLFGIFPMIIGSLWVTAGAMVVGVPNVGKSTIINTLAGSKTLKAEDRPGVTRANQWVRIAPFIEIMDSPGLLWPRLDDQQAARRLAYIAAIRDEVLDTYRLAQSLAEELMVLEPELFMNRFRVEDASLRGQALMEAICVGRGFIGRGAVPDLDRGASVLLDEFRAGRIGRISLETPPAEDSHAH